MTKQIKLSTRISWFAVLMIVMAGLVAFIGFSSQTGVIDRVKETDDINEIVKDILTIRQQEKNYIIYGKQESVEEVKNRLARIRELAESNRHQFKKKSNKSQMVRVSYELNNYKGAFEQYAAIENQKDVALAIMEKSGQAALDRLAELISEQEKQLTEGQKASMSLVKKGQAVVEGAGRAVQAILNARLEEKEFQISKKEDAAEVVEILIYDIYDIVDELSSKMDQEEDLKLAKYIQSLAGQYLGAFNQYVDNPSADILSQMSAYTEELQKSADKIRNSQKEWFAQTESEATLLIEEKLANANLAHQMIRRFLGARKTEQEFINTRDAQLLKDVAEGVKEVLAFGEELKKRFKSKDNLALINEAILAIGAYQNSFDSFLSQLKQQIQTKNEMVEAARSAEKACIDAYDNQNQEMAGRISYANIMLSSGTFTAIFLGIVLSFLLVRRINRTINPVIDGLGQGAANLASAASEISNTSQELAAGSSEQAAEVEETSATLEEITAMTKQNLGNAEHAETLVKKTNIIISETSSAMLNIVTSMDEISSASEETSKIIKTIDGIAFQTNLLALNAAVEAARAGEAGAGFAVVADEVRNLSMSAAEASRNTATLIEATIHKVKNGTSLVQTANVKFDDVQRNANKVAQLVGEIMAASNEQARGVDQVNQSVAQVNNVTQQNAANAEESASASEELNALAVEMQGHVGELMKLVGNSDNKHGGDETTSLEIESDTDPENADFIEDHMKRNNQGKKPMSLPYEEEGPY